MIIGNSIQTRQKFGAGKVIMPTKKTVKTEALTSLLNHNGVKTVINEAPNNVQIRIKPYGQGGFKVGVKNAQQNRYPSTIHIEPAVILQDKNQVDFFTHRLSNAVEESSKVK